MPGSLCHEVISALTHSGECLDLIHSPEWVSVFRKIYYLNIDELYKMKKKKKGKKKKQGKSEGFDSCDRPSNLTQIGFKSSIFQPVWPWNLMQINEI